MELGRSAGALTCGAFTIREFGSRIEGEAAAGDETVTSANDAGFGYISAAKLADHVA